MQLYTVYLYVSTTLPVSGGCSSGFTNTRCCGCSDMSSWWWVEIPPETCRAVYRYK